MRTHEFSRLETLFENDHARLQKGRYANEYYILKHYKDRLEDPAARERIVQEATIVAQLYPEQTILLDDQETPVLTMPFFAGSTLRAFIQDWSFDLPIFLDIAIELAGRIGEVHQKNIIYLNVNPAHIIYNPKEKSLALIDFSYARFFQQRNLLLSQHDWAAADLHYISPEQTGRIDRTVDFSSDLYSCGVVLFELATGAKLFENASPLELVHNHIAKLPPDPSLLNSGLPKPVADIILKLLAKDPEDRYQSHYGLLHDLQHCRRQVQDQGRIESFPLGQEDVNDKFRLPRRIYGRDKEIHILEQALSAAGEGYKQAIFIEGPSGVGKSSLMTYFRKEVEVRKGIFLQGKFDQYAGNTPYAAWGEVFDAFIEWIVTEDAPQIKQWKKILKKRLGKNIPYLAQLIPNLHWLFDDISEQELNSRSDAQNRFLYATLQFVLCITETKLPVVLFIDDWQWADTASVELLNSFLKDEYIHNLLFIASYREEEIDKNHAFSSALNQLEQFDHGTLLSLSNMPEEVARQLLQDTLNTRSEELNTLNQLIHSRTEGNVLYYTQFLSALRDDNIIRFDVNQRQWVWDIEEVRKSIISDSVVELMIKKIRRYAPDEQKLLQLASCVSSTFRLHTLSLVSGLSMTETESLLSTALADGLVEYLSQAATKLHKDKGEIELRFAHDRIQQSLYDMLSQEEKEQYHFKIGKVVLDKWASERIDQHIFAITEQLNKGAVLSEDPEQLRKIAELNWQSSQKAKILADFDNALHYAQQGIDLLKRAQADPSSPLSIELQLHIYELAYLLHRKDRIRVCEETLHGLSLSDHQQALLANIKVDGLISQGELAQAIDVGLEILHQHGFKFRKNPGTADIIAAAVRTQLAYKKSKIDQLIDLPVITDPLTLTLFRIVQSVNGAAYFSNNNLWVFMNIKTMRYYIQKGLCPLASLTASAYGATLIIGSKDIKGGIAFGKLALSIMDKLNTSADANRILFTYYTLISWWGDPLSVSFQHIRKALDLSLSYGDFQFAGHCTNILASYTLCTGRFPEHRKNLAYYKTLAGSLNDYTNSICVNIYSQYFAALTDPACKPEGSEGEVYTFRSSEEHETYKDHQVLVFTNYGSSMKYHYLMKDYRQAYTFADKLKSLPNSGYGTYIALHTSFYTGLAKAAYYHDLDTATQRTVLKELKKLLKDFKRLARLAPVNFENKYLLLQGHYLQLSGQHTAALEALHQSVELSKKNDFFTEEAIAWESCADIYLEVGQDTMARLCLQSAYQIHKDCGARAVCYRIRKQYPWLEKARTLNRTPSTVAAENTSNTLAGLDLRSILKSSEALIGETDYDKLLKKLILIAIENAGAEKCYLLLKKGDVLEISAFGDIDKHTRIFKDTDSQSFPEISQKVAQYVAASKEVVILSDAANDPKFGSDSYFTDGSIKSVFALPIMNKGQFVGLLYFENNRTKNAFTNDRVELMKLLSGQIAISIENAVLVENLEEKVKERTLQIQQEKDNSEKLLLNILPKATADELQLTGKAQPRFYEQASVMFLDFKDFSKSRLDYRDLVNNLDAYFKAFDEIIGSYQIEKIKTIGDAYMCAGGLPVESEDHAIQLCQAAIEMQQLIARYKRERIAQDLPYFEARIGIHSGPVIAGVVGSKKFAYDIWGDTVNIASRLENGCSVGCIAISESTYQLVKGKVTCQPKEKISAKNIGELDVYYLSYQ